MSSKNTNENAKKVGDVLREAGIGIEEILSFVASFNEKTLAAAYNYYKVENVKTYTFKEALEWIQDKLDKDKHGGATITRETQDNKIILKCCFLDTNKKPLAKFGDLFLNVSTDSICQDFKDNFGDKNMIVIE
ncbi:hypothetical protein LS77_005205 [Helicobacter bilis]|uniref:Uncharacterized protein n=2 Tax=Helicobacter bilis TaxID=37372 RepID=A0A6D2CAP4_9HELI|nr:hypothetical protein [Helicobacter bilis]EMZ38431.1 hypothetical protein C826_01467 [Helicobacter bilis WiWa]TLE04772.1 hypothetical protein LS77_005205 [Helicobacter bilis]TLE06041.1 hypothetical protein LS76_004180 [Helicobacter bilis]